MNDIIQILRVVMMVLSMSAVIGVSAYDCWYDKPLAIDGRRVPIDTVYTDVLTADIHARMLSDDWSLCWGDEAAGARCQARLRKWGGDDSGVYPVITTLTVVTQGHDGDSTIISKDLGLDPDEYHSIKLSYDSRTGAVLNVGDKMTEYTVRVPFSSGEVAVYASAPGQCRYLRCQCEYAPEALYAGCDDVESLLTDIYLSDDPCSGVWSYLDRDMYSEKATLGGKYRIATIPSGDGYDIVYLSGATVNVDHWQPLRLKGRLQPTAFRNQYNASWYAADGHLLSDEVSAEISEDNSMLTLRIPLLQATLRFFREKE